MDDMTHVRVVKGEGNTMAIDVHNGRKGTHNDPICINNNTFATGSPQNGTMECDTPSNTFKGKLSFIVTSETLNVSIELCEVEFYGKRKYKKTK